LSRLGGLVPSSKAAFLKELAVQLPKDVDVGVMVDGENVDIFLNGPKFEITMGENDLVIGDFTGSVLHQQMFDEIMNA
jgi:hypothetical protein